MELVLLVIGLLALVATVFSVLTWRKIGDEKSVHEIGKLHGLVEGLGHKVSELRGKVDGLDSIPKTLQDSMTSMRAETGKSLGDMRTELGGKFDNLQGNVTQQLEQVRNKTEESFKDFRKESTDAMEKIRQNTDTKLETIRKGNEQKLDQMRQTVDEKLQKTLNERIGQSFKEVSEQLRTVNESFGEMKQISTNVNSLQKVLTSAPQRGALGEVVLKDMLRQLLTSSQYEENVAIQPNSSERVEFAINIPVSDDTMRLLPVDSKFPMTHYESYIEALENANKEEAKKHLDNLIRYIKSMAKSINEKYVHPPHSTDIAVMFVPNEGIYSVIANSPGLLNKLHEEHNVRVAGPNNFASMLDAIRIGMHLFAIGRRTDEIQKVLGATRTEFTKFSKLLAGAQKNLHLSMSKLDKLSGTRTRAIRRALQDVDTLPESESDAVLGISVADDSDLDLEENQGEDS